MSTTMNMHIEVKKNGQWLHFSSPAMGNIKEQYLIYACMTGERLDSFRPSIREQIHPVASIKGLPDNMSEVTKICYEQDAEQYHLHGEHTLTADDIRKLQEQLWDLNPYDNKLYWDLEDTVFRTYLNGNSIASHQGWDDVRIICWYNN